MSALKICPQCGTEYELDQSFCPKDGSTLRSQSGTADLVGQIIADRYRVMKKLGEGGMGTVYLAEHVKMGRKSAVKVMNPGMVNDADAISRFNREAANASRINHPNVAAVYDFGETKDGLIYLAMEFIEGPSLTSVIEQSGSLPPMRAAEITRQAGEALAVAHDMGIVHRDLKPDNIMLAKGRDGADVVKVVDFGIAKAAEVENQKVTKTGLVVGTPEYMSPEQLAGDKLDGRSDTYSLALVSFAMLTGKLPFPADTIQESMIKRLTDAPKLLGEMKPETSWTQEVQAVMDRALERDLANRYQSATEFGRALHQAVSQTMPRGRASGATAVIEAPVAPAARPAAPPAGGGKTVPQTRVNPATPHTPPKAIPAPAAPAKSKTPMFAAIGIVAVLAVGGGAYAVLNKPDPVESFNNQVAGGAAPAGAPSSPATAALPLSRRFEVLDSMANAGATSAHGAIDSLRAIEPMAVSDSDFVRLRWVRVQANVTLNNFEPACRELRSIEGKAQQTRFKDAINNLLKTCS